MFYDTVDEESEREVTEQVFKIIIIGDSGVGKTCLAHRFATGKFPERTEATIGVDFWERKLQLNGTNIRVSWFIFICTQWLDAPLLYISRLGLFYYDCFLNILNVKYLFIDVSGKFLW